MEKSTSLLNDKLHWYKDAIIYELHIKAFKDANGDGIGDFEGLLQQLDYLQELGVTAIWLLPFYPSPLKDDGYDIADYYNINPSYGTIEQFKQLLDEAHKRNLKVITELVINHSSDQHPWFQRARKAPKGSPERDFYVWTNDPSQWKDVRIIFQDYETSNWTWDAVAQQYYWHRFFHHQPDLNYDSLLVQEEVIKVLDYWCEMGVDGFRLDAVPYLFEREGTNGENLPETHEFLKKLRTHIDQKFPGTVFLAEANMWPEDSASYFGNGDECHMNYHFPVMPRMFMSLQMEDRYPITDIFDQTPEIPETCQWAIFLRNHDELTLEMVTDEERDFMYKVYAKDPKARINLGIRHRLAPLLENNRRKIELMNSLLFSLPGTPVVYYGDEIGMGDNFYLGDRDGVRTPMQWTADKNAGFSAANPHSLYLPTILDPEYHYESVNVELQRRNTSSLFWFMKRIINMRKQYKAFGRGDLKFLQVENPKVLAFTRTYEDQTLLIIVNLSKFSQPAELHIGYLKGYIPVEAFSKNKFPAIQEDAPYFFTLGSYSFEWFVLEKAENTINKSADLPLLQINTWEDILQGQKVIDLQEQILPAYLKKTTWFSGGGKSIYAVKVIQQAAIALNERSALFLLIEVSYESGLPEIYQLPIAFIKEQLAGKLTNTCPQSIICQLKIGQQDGLLCDALYTAEVQHQLFKKIAGNERLTVKENSIQFKGNELVSKHVKEFSDIKPKIHSEDKGITSITFDNKFFLKMYRKVDTSINPDVEITKYLSEDLKFANTPAYNGLIEWNTSTGNFVLGMLQVMVENHGDSNSYMLERINNFIERILARDRQTLPPEERLGSLTNPVGYEELPEDLKIFIGGPASEHARLLGVRTAEMHIALSTNSNDKDFKPEDFSLHYQRSLFASMQTLVRESYHGLNNHIAELPTELLPGVEDVVAKKDVILSVLKRIYDKKLEALKIRIHGKYELHDVLLTGKDIAIHNFGGEQSRTYSERRLKRSPLRDVAALIRSFHYVAYEGFFSTTHLQKENTNSLLPYAEMWSFYMSSFFLKAYLDTVNGTMLIPNNKPDLVVMLETYLLEKAVSDFKYEITNRPAWVVVPLRIIQSIIDKN